MGYHIVHAWANDPSRKMPGFVFTSNIDGHHARAGGMEPDLLFECHGSLMRMQCVEPCTYDDTRNSTADEWETQLVPFPAEGGAWVTGKFPSCPLRKCKRRARPNVVMFGDSSYIGYHADRQEEKYTAWVNDMLKNPDVGKLTIIEIGAGTTVDTVRRSVNGLVRKCSRAGNVMQDQRRVYTTHIRINPDAKDAGSVEATDGNVYIPARVSDSLALLCSVQSLLQE